MSRIRTLIVEDEPLARRTLREILAGVPWLECVGEAETGTRAVEMIDALTPDLVLLDIEMPEMSGYETARRVRAQAANRPVQIIAISVWGRESDRAAGRLAGFNHHLTKPLLFDQLAKVLPH